MSASPTLTPTEDITSAAEGSQRVHSMDFGAEVLPSGHVRFRLWGPGASTISIELDGHSQPLPMTPELDGWHELVTDQAAAGTCYQFVLPDGLHVPDPASRFQPEDVHGPSEVIDPTAYIWQDGDWQGRPWSDTILYELHIGAFTPEGTFTAAISKLDHLVQLGVTAIEIMPVADFPGKRNWGYDGVLLYAPDSSYGRPEDLKALVDAAHARGLSVLLDVVYNHFGPDGNYLSTYAPQTFTDHHKTPWGDAINYDAEGSPVVREFVIQNALYWMNEFHLDGLRLDAVHEIKDDGQKHILDDIAGRVRSSITDRPVHLVLENESNQSFRLVRDDQGNPVDYTAQWNDDMHHVLHTAATLESNGYYGDYAEDTEKLGRALAEGFAFQGEVMKSRGSERGEPSAQLPPGAFVAFMQNHDQIGNRAFGERINAIASPEAVHAIAAVYLLLPQTPMLFMGEEWGSSQPFPFFCDFEGELADLIRKGRRDEFKNFPEFHDPEKRELIPDPLAAETFEAAKLDWGQCSCEGVHADWVEWYTHVLSVRRKSLGPLIPAIRGNAGTYSVVGPGAVVVTWDAGGHGTLELSANLFDNSTDGFPEPTGETLWQEGSPQAASLMRPWSVRWSLKPNQF